jgi:hypothetical protein
VSGAPKAVSNGSGVRPGPERTCPPDPHSSLRDFKLGERISSASPTRGDAAKRWPPLKFHAPIGQTRIWWGRVDLYAPPVEQEFLLTFHKANGRHIVVDMAGWGRSASSFQDFVSTAFDDAKRARQTQSADEWTELPLFCFKELDETITVRIADRRRFHLIVKVGRRLSSRDKNGPDLKAFE